MSSSSASPSSIINNNDYINASTRTTHAFCDNYLELRPEEASILGLIRLLWSQDLEDIQKNFIESPEVYLRGFRYRWLIFISIVMQKMIMSMKTPMAKADYFVGVSLNFVSNNGGSIWKLFLNFIRGKVERPDKSMASFRSTVGNLDTRVDLDKHIQTGTPRYKAALSLMAAKLSYENDAFIQAVVQHEWKMKLLGCYNFWNDFHQKHSTQAFMLHKACPNPDKKKEELIVIAFRGTGPLDADAWCIDIDFSWFEIEGVGKVHGGFMKALGLQRYKGWPKELDPSSESHEFAYYTLRDKLKHIFKTNKNAKFMVTGHSLGGALAILFVAVLILHKEEDLLRRLEGVYTFGQPRVGDKGFGEFMKRKLKMFGVKYFRFVYCNDVVPRLPYDDTFLFYKHFGPCLYYDSFYRGQVLPEEPNRNYFSILWAIPKYLNAVWELIRGFIIPWLRGSSYREGWCLRSFRLIGLIFPGLANHGPQDYDNITRLGDQILFPLYNNHDS